MSEQYLPGETWSERERRLGRDPDALPTDVHAPGGQAFESEAGAPKLRISLPLEKFQKAFGEKFGTGCDIVKFENDRGEISYGVKVQKDFDPNRLQELAPVFNGVDFAQHTYDVNNWVVPPQVMAALIPEIDVSDRGKVVGALRQFEYLKTAEVSEHAGNLTVSNIAPGCVPSHVFTAQDTAGQEALDRTLDQIEVRAIQKIIFISCDAMRTALSQIKEPKQR